VVKPIDMHELVATIARMLAGNSDDA
jgi:hypothetical protein